MPACTPVTREPIASANPPGWRSPESRLISGTITCLRPWMLTAAQSLRSTTRTGGTSTCEVRPVYAATCPAASSVSARSSDTTAIASS